MNTDDFADVARSAKRAMDAPPVVASMVVYRPGPWFEESLQARAAQTYPQLQTLFLVVGVREGDDGGLTTDPTELIHSILPQAVVRHIEGNPGFGLVSNELGNGNHRSQIGFGFKHMQVTLCQIISFWFPGPGLYR